MPAAVAMLPPGSRRNSDTQIEPNAGGLRNPTPTRVSPRSHMDSPGRYAQQMQMPHQGFSAWFNPDRSAAQQPPRQFALVKPSVSATDGRPPRTPTGAAGEFSNALTVVSQTPPMHQHRYMGSPSGQLSSRGPAMVQMLSPSPSQQMNGESSEPIPSRVYQMHPQIEPRLVHQPSSTPQPYRSMSPYVTPRQRSTSPQRRQTQGMSGAPYENLQFGVGIEFAPGRRELIVSSVVAGCSAYVEGTVQIGDELVEAAGVRPSDYGQALKLILGRQGTSVILTFRRQTGTEMSTHHVTLLRGNSDYIQLDKKFNELLRENEELRSSLRQQNDEVDRRSEREKKTDEEATNVQTELHAATSERDSLRKLIDEKNIRIHDLENKLKKAEQDVKNGVAVQWTGEYVTQKEEDAQEASTAPAETQRLESEEKMKKHCERLQEKLCKLMQHKINNLQEADDMKAEILSLQIKVARLEAEAGEERMVREREQQERNLTRERSIEPKRYHPSPYAKGTPLPNYLQTLTRSASDSTLFRDHYVSPSQHDAAVPKQFPDTVSPHTTSVPHFLPSNNRVANRHPSPSPRPLIDRLIGSNDYPKVSISPPAPHPLPPVNRMLVMDHNKGSFQQQLPLPPRPAHYDAGSHAHMSKDQPRLTSMPAPAVVFLQEEIAAASDHSAWSGLNDQGFKFNGNMQNSYVEAWIANASEERSMIGANGCEAHAHSPLHSPHRSPRKQAGQVQC